VNKKKLCEFRRKIREMIKNPFRACLDDRPESALPGTNMLPTILLEAISKI